MLATRLLMKIDNVRFQIALLLYFIITRSWSLYLCTHSMCFIVNCFFTTRYFFNVKEKNTIYIRCVYCNILYIFYALM